MVAFLITALALSLLGMLALLLAKHYELSTGRLFLAPVRPATSRFFERLARLINTILPAMARHYMRQGLQALLMRIQRALMRSVAYLERMLAQGLEIVRERSERLPQGEPSAFLRQVSDHKKSLNKPE